MWIYIINVMAWCFICKKMWWGCDSLFLHCAVASDMWGMVYSLFGVSWVMPLSVREMIKGWKGCFGRHGNGAVWQAAPLYLMWSIWNESNARYHDQAEIYIPQVLVWVDIAAYIIFDCRVPRLFGLLEIFIVVSFSYFFCSFRCMSCCIQLVYWQHTFFRFK